MINNLEMHITRTGDCSNIHRNYLIQKVHKVKSSSLQGRQLHKQRLVLTTAQSSDVPSSSKPSSSIPSQQDPAPKSLREEAERSNAEVYDRLVDVFSAKDPEDWRKLIAFSKQWPSLAKGVLERFEHRATTHEDPDEARTLRRTARKLKIVSDELAEYKAALDTFRAAASREWESMVTRQRPILTSDFFDYLELRIRASGDNNKEAEAIASLAAQLAALVEAHDRIARDEDALDSAGERFASLLQAESLEAAEAKIDELAASGQLDPALLLTMAKAYAGVKETDITQEEVKDVMAHLYFKAKESFARQAPPEVRILKFLLSVESDSERMVLLEQAFTPGPELTTNDEDYLATSPEAMMNTITNVLQLYEQSRGGGGTMAGQAAQLMNPEVIENVKKLQAIIRSKYF